MVWIGNIKQDSDELMINNTWDKLRDHLEVIKGMSFIKAEKKKSLLTKVNKDALQNAILTNEQVLAVFQSGS